MIVDDIRKERLDAGSIPATSTLMCRRRPPTRRVSAGKGVIGLDSVQVCIPEIVVAYKRQFCSNVCAPVKDGRIDRQPGSDIPGFVSL